MRKIVHVGRLRYVIYMGDKRGSLWHYIPLHLVMVMRYSVLCFFIMHLMIQHIGSVVVRGVGVDYTSCWWESWVWPEGLPEYSFMKASRSWLEYLTLDAASAFMVFLCSISEIKSLMLFRASATLF
jgi:hypothetical protein